MVHSCIEVASSLTGGGGSGGAVATGRRVRATVGGGVCTDTSAPALSVCISATDESEVLARVTSLRAALHGNARIAHTVQGGNGRGVRAGCRIFGRVCSERHHIPMQY